MKLGYLQTHLESLCCAGGEKGWGDRGREGQRQERERIQTMRVSPLKGEILFLLSLLIQNLSPVISETDVPR